MDIKFWKFEEKKDAQQISVIGFGAPENTNNALFHVFGHVSRLSNAVDVHFHRKLKSFKTHSNGNKRITFLIFSVWDAHARSIQNELMKNRSMQN